MLFRALFWIAIVLVFMPCDPGEATSGFGFLHDSLLSRLEQIKHDIESDQHARGAWNH